jgi:hypothetical protein
VEQADDLEIAADAFGGNGGQCVAQPGAETARPFSTSPTTCTRSSS